jgi:tetratricopeptide (TPR) repeat protein
MIANYDRQLLMNELNTLLEKTDSEREFSNEYACNLSKIGLIYYKLGDPLTELKYIQKSLETKQKCNNFEGDHIETANELINLGNSYSHNGEFKYELRYKLEGMRMIKRLMENSELKDENKLLFSQYLCELAIAYRNNSDYVNELKYQLDAFNIRKNFKNSELEAESINFIGIAYGNNGDYKRELKFKLEALILIQKYYKNNELNLKIANFLDS